MSEENDRTSEEIAADIAVKQAKVANLLAETASTEATARKTIAEAEKLN